MLTALQSVRHCNAMALDWVRPHLSRLEIEPVVIVNDAHGQHPDFPTDSAERVCEEHAIVWPACETMIGNFDYPRLRWTVGAEETWSVLLGQARTIAPGAQSPFEPVG